jgi:putative two-component system response regulator
LARPQDLVSSGENTILLTAARIALTHHEKWDGSGYPRGLSGEAIPIEGRITSVADVFDALTSARSYKPAMPATLAVQTMEKGRGQHFDPKVLDAMNVRFDNFLKILSEQADPPASNPTHLR